MAELASGYKEREVLNFYSRENGTYIYPYLEFPPTLAKHLNLWQFLFYSSHAPEPTATGGNCILFFCSEARLLIGEFTSL